MKELAQTIAEKGAAYCSNPDLLTFMFGKMNPDIRRFLDRFISTGDVPPDGKLPRTTDLKVKAFIELGRRLFVKDLTRINSSNDIALLCKDMADLTQEHFVAITINGANCVITRRTVFIGTLNRSLVHPREIFIDAISDRAAGLILVHNHPSGSFEPSLEDVTMTKRLAEASAIVGIPIVDHVIIGGNGHYSFEGNGLIKREG